MKYNLPPLEEESPEPDIVTAPPSARERRVEIPVNDAIMDHSKIGQEISIGLVGRVIEIHSTEESETTRTRKTITLEISSVEGQTSYEAAEEEFEMGFGNGPKRAY